MRLPFYIARRYLFAKKSHNAINIITLVSSVGVMVGTMALVPQVVDAVSVPVLDGTFPHYADLVPPAGP